MFRQFLVGGAVSAILLRRGFEFPRARNQTVSGDGGFFEVMS